jgi:hypothetical protein
MLSLDRSPALSKASLVREDIAAGVVGNCRRHDVQRSTTNGFGVSAPVEISVRQACCDGLSAEVANRTDKVFRASRSP